MYRSESIDGQGSPFSDLTLSALCCMLGARLLNVYGSEQLPGPKDRRKERRRTAGWTPRIRGKDPYGRSGVAMEAPSGRRDPPAPTPTRTTFSCLFERKRLLLTFLCCLYGAALIASRKKYAPSYFFSMSSYCKRRLYSVGIFLFLL